MYESLSGLKHFSGIMPNCPRCHQSIDAQAVSCPYCRTHLKAYGHPGIPLHRASGEESLCQSCTYHADDTCTFTQRPHAKECTLYQDVSGSQLQVNQRRDTSSPAIAVSRWVRHHQAWLILLSLLIVSFLFALRSSPQPPAPTPQNPHLGDRQG